MQAVLQSLRKGLKRRGFTLMELMVAMGILIMLVVIIAQITNSVMATTSRTSSKIDAFASARAGFDLVNQRLSQATLNSYWGYDNVLNPTVYLRESDLQFVVRQNQQNAGYGQEVYFPTPEAFSGLSAIRSTSGLLNACSFFVQYGGNDAFHPATSATTRYRYRLMQGLQPTESSLVFTTPYTTGSPGWIADICNNGGTPATTGTCVTPLADNVIALVVWPRLSKNDDPTGTKLSSGAGTFTYDSCLSGTSVPQPITANQLPPTVQITMVMISEASAQRLDTHSTTPPAVIEEALDGRFVNITEYSNDLSKMEAVLIKNHVEYQIFTTAVPLKESKWSDASQ